MLCAFSAAPGPHGALKEAPLKIAVLYYVRLKSHRVRSLSFYTHRLHNKTADCFWHPNLCLVYFWAELKCLEGCRSWSPWRSNGMAWPPPALTFAVWPWWRFILSFAVLTRSSSGPSRAPNCVKADLIMRDVTPAFINVYCLLRLLFVIIALGHKPPAPTRYYLIRCTL